MKQILLNKSKLLKLGLRFMVWFAKTVRLPVFKNIIARPVMKTVQIAKIWVDFLKIFLISGFLIGGASLKSASFIKIIKNYFK